MSTFKDFLGADQTIVQNENALEYEFVPKLLPFREEQQRYIAQCVKPLLADRNGRNLIIHGAPGIGKTAVIRLMMRELEEEAEDVIPLYINCWQKNTTFKVMIELCHQLDYMFTQNKKTEELMEVVKNNVNKKAAVFIFDEIDKAEDFDFLYTLIEEVYKKSIILITNYKEVLLDLDDRIKSRLTPDILEFKPYTLEETKKIILYRIKCAFYPDVWENSAEEIVVKRAFEKGDIRMGIYLLRESGRIAEDKSSKKVKVEDAEEALKKLDDFSIKKEGDLEEDTRIILRVCQNNSGKKIGDLFKVYRKSDGQNTYKTFQRKIEKLAKSKFIKVEKTAGGAEGNTTIVTVGEKEKKLTDF